MGHDLVIVGAGIIGTVAAYQAARRHPEWRIVIIDRSRVASGSTGFSAGLATNWGQTPQKRAMATRAAALFAEMAQEIPDAALEPQEIAWLVERRSAARFSAAWAGNPPRALTGAAREELVARLPRGLLIRPEVDIHLDATARVGDPPAVCRAVIAWLRSRARVEVWEGVLVTSVARTDSGAAVWTEDRREVEAKRLLAFPGPWVTQNTWAPSLAGAQVRIKKVVALHIDQPPDPATPAVYFFDDEAFLLPKHREGRSLLSITSQRWDCEPAVASLHLEPDDLQLADRTVKKFFDGGLRPAGGQVFCDAYTPDHTPAIRLMGGLEHAAIGYGSSGSGFRLAPAIAESGLRVVEAADRTVAETPRTDTSFPVD